MLPNVVLFQAQDALNQSSLWETNGTASGTFELAPAGANSLGLSPTDITVLGAQVLFAGVDSSGDVGLWTSDGTAAGTVELTSITGASSAGVAPADLTVFGSDALFSGINSSGQTGLWITNGTAGGTYELSSITGAASTGVQPSDLTVFNGKALFAGSDTAGHLGLWVTNGAVAGTQELTGVAGASTTGLDPSDMVVFNNEVLFNGVDANGLSGLWATDGTVGGTHELVPGAGGVSDPAGLNPTNITVLNGEILFSGLDASGDMGLWVSDGTAAGTHELTGITGADSSGLAPGDLTVLNGEVLFRGLDQSGQAALWITDGTVAGTHELTGIAGSSTTGIGLDPSGFAVYGGVALFSGYDSSGNLELWQTNGAAAGTTEIGPVSGSESMGLSPTDLTAIGMVGPVLTAGANVSYVTGAAPVTLDAALSVADATAASLSAATVSISAGFVLGDTLSVGSPQTGIVSQYNAATGVLTLSGSASLVAYKTELDSITYASANATTSTRTITWSVNDGVNASAPTTSHVSVSRLPPVVTAGASVSYLAGATPVALDAGLALADAAAVSLSAATVSISAGFVLGDTLSVGSPQTGIVSQYNAATGVLTLSGAASLAAYETELELHNLRLGQRHDFEPNDPVVRQRRRQRVRSSDQQRLGQQDRPRRDCGRERELRRRSEPCRARRRASRRRRGGEQPVRGHSQHQRRLRSGRYAERRLSPDRHRQPVQRRHRRVDFVRRGEPRRLSDGTQLHNLRLSQRHDFEPNDHLVRQRRRQPVRPSDQQCFGQLPSNPSPSGPDPEYHVAEHRVANWRSGK